jgi:hypothetical protein
MADYYLIKLFKCPYESVNDIQDVEDYEPKAVTSWELAKQRKVSLDLRGGTVVRGMYVIDDSYSVVYHHDFGDYIVIPPEGGSLELSLIIK